jgi:hypothetical protein
LSQSIRVPSNNDDDGNDGNNDNNGDDDDDDDTKVKKYDRWRYLVVMIRLVETI